MMKNDGLHVDEAGSQEWWKDGNLHREDGPAVVGWGGGEMWYHKGMIHRLNGPAVFYRDGTHEWWLNDKPRGLGEDGFWVFWKELNSDQRENVTLLKFFMDHYNDKH
jgi:hypothetical protein